MPSLRMIGCLPLTSLPRSFWLEQAGSHAGNRTTFTGSSGCRPLRMQGGQSISVARTCRRMATADGMGMGRCMVTPPRPSWELAMGLSMDKPKAVAACLLAGYREWTAKGFKGEEPRFRRSTN